MLNAKDQNGWGTEERNAGGMPLTKGDIFDLTIVNGDAVFEVCKWPLLSPIFQIAKYWDDFSATFFGAFW